MQDSELTVMVELESSHGSHSYASVTFNDISTRMAAAHCHAHCPGPQTALLVLQWKLQVLRSSLSAVSFHL